MAEDRETIAKAIEALIFAADRPSNAAGLRKAFPELTPRELAGYSEVKKLRIIYFISKYLLLYLTRSISIYLTLIKPFKHAPNFPKQSIEI